MPGWSMTRSGEASPFDRLASAGVCTGVPAQPTRATARADHLTLPPAAMLGAQSV